MEAFKNYRPSERMQMYIIFKILKENFNPFLNKLFYRAKHADREHFILLDLMTFSIG